VKRFLGFRFWLDNVVLDFDNTVSCGPRFLRFDTRLGCMSRHFFCLVTAVTTAPFVPGHDGFVFDSLLLPFYDELIEKLKRRRLTASR
jgi:hypothetical protein